LIEKKNSFQNIYLFIFICLYVFSPLINFPPLRQKFKDESETQAMELLNSSVANVEEKKKMYSSLFPYSKLSDASNDFKASATSATNEKVALAVSTTLDQVSEQSIVLDKLEHFITLHVPKIEDGGNFGVG